MLNQVKQAPFTAVFHRDMMAGARELFSDVIDIVPPSAWDHCMQLYGSGVRAYHTFEHALDVLWRVQVVQATIGFVDYEAAVVAALFHDAVYEIGRLPGQNEERSLEEAYAVASRPGTTLSRDVVDRAAPLILATALHGKHKMDARHDGDGVAWDVALFLDCDMAGFALAPPEFDKQNAAIDKEFMGKVEPALYRTGRASFLENLKTRGVFLTPPFVRAGEAWAQANLLRELARVDTWMAR